MSFDIRQTNIAKGIAILLLLWHHLFFNSTEYYDLFTSIYFHSGKPIECSVAVFCKVCVAIFVFLSGFGLFKSFTKFRNNNLVDNKLSIIKQVVFVRNHLIKLFSGYIFIYVIFVSLGFVFGRNPVEIYEGNILYMIVDLLGLSYLFSFPTMNATWWFMSTIIVYYLLFPLLYRIQEYCSELLLVISGFLMFMPVPDYKELLMYLFPFILGMYISKYNGIEWFACKFNSNVKAIVVCSFSIIFFAYWRLTFFGKIDGLFGLTIIVFSFLIVSKIPILNKILEELGKYSSSIFMFHTFILGYYFKDITYSLKYSILIYIVFLISCYVIARLLSWLKHITKYDIIISKLTK